MYMTTYKPREVDPNKDYICNRLRLYNYLFKKGIFPKEVREDYLNPLYRVWVYEPTEELRTAVYEYYDMPYYHKFYQSKLGE